MKDYIKKKNAVLLLEDGEREYEYELPNVEPIFEPVVKPQYDNINVKSIKDKVKSKSKQRVRDLDAFLENEATNYKKKRK